MKLLEKKQINEVVQKERKTQIDSGIFLATKVDKLRQELLDLEKQRTDFITGSQETLHVAIVDLKKEKDNLSFEVKEAKKQLAKLREPLDEEWKQVAQLKDELEMMNSNVQISFLELVKDRKELQQDKDDTLASKNTALENQSETERLLAKAQLERTETKRILNEVKSANANKEVELYIKENTLNEKEKSLKVREDLLRKERLELNKEIKLLSIKKQNRICTS